MIKIHYNSLWGVFLKKQSDQLGHNVQKHSRACKIVTENQVKKRKNPPEKADFLVDTLFFKKKRLSRFISLPKPGRTKMDTKF